MVIAVPGDAGSTALVPHTDEQQPQDLLLSAIDPAQRDGSLPVAPQSHCVNNATFVDLDPAVYEQTTPVPTRRGLASSPALFLWESRTTNVDVMSVSNTTRPVVVSSSRNSERRRIQVVLPYGVGSGSSAGGAAASGGKHRGFGGGAHRRAWAAAAPAPAAGGATMMGLLDSPNATPLEAQLNEARRVKRGRDLRRERRLFLSRLTHEREERVHLEAWASTRIQALFRGFLARPRPPRPNPQQRLTPAESNRRLVADLQEILARAGLPTIPGLGPDGRKTSGGPSWDIGRGGGGGTAGAGTGAGAGGGDNGGRGGLRRSRSRRQRLFEDEMSTRITRVVRGFLERRRFGRRWAVWNRKRRWSGASRIQHAWRAYRKRMGWRELESEVMGRAATRIQACWRGMACRMALARRATEDALGKRRAVSAVTIQTAARRRAAIAKHGSSLTLGTERRKREARAAAEAARPRRRWNRGGPSAGSGSAAATAAAPPPAGTGMGAGVGCGGGGGIGADKADAASSACVASASGNASAGSSQVASSSGKKLGKGDNVVGEEPAHGWEQGPPNPTAEAGGKQEGGGGGGDGGDRKKDGGDAERGGPSESGVGDEGRGDESLHGGALPGVKKKRASQQATLRFVRESVHAAVVNAGAIVSSTGGEAGVGVHLATPDVLGDLDSTGVATEVVVPATADCGNLRIHATGEPESVIGSASKLAA
eukprot:g9861.t1